MADLNILSASCLLRSSIEIKASSSMRSAVDFLPRIIMMLTNFATSRLPYFGSGNTSRFAAPARRMALASGALGGLGAVLRAALLAAGHARGVERAADDVIPDTRQVLHAPAADHHDRVLLQVVPHPRDVRRDLEAVGEPDAGDFPESRVRLLRGGRVDADAHAPLLRTPLHRRRLRLAPYRLATVMDELIDSRHGSPSPRRATKLQRYNRDALSCQRFSGHIRITRPPRPSHPSRRCRPPAASRTAHCLATSPPRRPGSALRPACSSRAPCPPESGGRRSRSPSGHANRPSFRRSRPRSAPGWSPGTRPPR